MWYKNRIIYKSKTHKATRKLRISKSGILWLLNLKKFPEILFEVEVADQYSSTMAEEMRAKSAWEHERYRGETLAAFQLEVNKLRTRKEEGKTRSAYASRRRSMQKKRRRGSVEARKARGTSKNDRSEGEGEGLKRISATIAAAADFQTIRQASGAIAFREENSSRRLDISRQEKEEGKIRRRNTEKNKDWECRISNFLSILIRFYFPLDFNI